jgi:hypothetical protein
MALSERGIAVGLTVNDTACREGNEEILIRHRGRVTGWKIKHEHFHSKVGILTYTLPLIPVRAGGRIRNRVELSDTVCLYLGIM